MASSGRSSAVNDIASPEQYCTQRRLRAIYDARDAIPEAEKKAYEMRYQGLIGDDMVALAVRKAVVHYILELEPLLRNRDEYEEYWKDIKLGIISFDDAGHEVPVVGLEEYVELPDILTAEYIVEEDDIFHGPQMVERADHQPVPKHISMAAYRTANQFVYEANIGVDFGPTDVEDPNPI